MSVVLEKLKPGTKVRSDFHSRWRFVPPSDKPGPDVEADMIRTLERIDSFLETLGLRKMEK